MASEKDLTALTADELFERYEDGELFNTPEWEPVRAELLDRVRRLAPPPAQPVRPIDGKFGINGQEIVNLVSGEVIPRDEPLFLLRARDRHALELLQNYIGICAEDCNELHLAGGRQVYEKFATFAIEYPERMKQPGVTRHLKLEAEAPPAQDVKEAERYWPIWLASKGWTENQGKPWDQDWPQQWAAAFHVYMLQLNQVKP